MSRKPMSKEEKKPHLTLNINETLLNRLDEKDGEKRSRLIERLIEDYIKNKTKNR